MNARTYKSELEESWPTEDLEPLSSPAKETTALFGSALQEASDLAASSPRPLSFRPYSDCEASPTDLRRGRHAFAFGAPRPHALLARSKSQDPRLSVPRTIPLP